MKKILCILAASLAALTVFSLIVFADNNSSTDPLVTLSYIKQVFLPEVQKALDDKIKENNEKLDDVIAEKLTENDALSEIVDKAVDEKLGESDDVDAKIEAASQYKAICISKGQSLIANAACEIILRSGKAIALSPFANQGLSDVSSGAEVLNGRSISLNHLLLIPRGDGRGVFVGEGEAWFMVRGAYTILDKDGKPVTDGETNTETNESNETNENTENNSTENNGNNELQP